MNQDAQPTLLASTAAASWRSSLPAARLAREEGFLRGRLRRLYGSTPDFDAWFDELLNAVARLHAERPADLLALDAQRAAEPNWFLSQKMLGYSAYVDRFAGTLKGVSGRIPHLVELGVNYLHLLPFLRARAGENDGGFAVSSFDEVEPRLGNIADLEILATQLRAEGISLCSDLVLNHVADDHPWALAAKAGDVHYRNYFHIFADRSEPDAYEVALGQVFPVDAPGNFVAVDALGGWVWSSFYPYQWDLNYANPAVFSEMATAMLRLANRGIEAFRLDSAAYLWKRCGTACMNQPEAHWILQALRSIVNLAAPGVLLKAEAIVPSAELPSYFGAHDAETAGRECHLAYQSCLMAASWVAVAEQNVELLKIVVQTTPALPAPGSWLSYVRCHDDIGWNVLKREAGHDGGNADARLAAVSQYFAGRSEGSFACGSAFQTSGDGAAHGSNGMAASLLGVETAADAATLAHAESRLELLHGLALCFGGMPLLYMGDEFAQTNDTDPAVAAARALDSRWLQRPQFDDQLYAQRHNTASLAGRSYARMRKLIALRRQLPELAANAPVEWLATSHAALLAIRRGEHFLVLGNFSARPIALDLAALPGLKAALPWRDGLSGEKPGTCFALKPWQLLWLLGAHATVSLD